MAAEKMAASKSGQPPSDPGQVGGGRVLAGGRLVVGVGGAVYASLVLGEGGSFSLSYSQPWHGFPLKGYTLLRRLDVHSMFHEQCSGHL